MTTLEVIKLKNKLYTVWDDSIANVTIVRKIHIARKYVSSPIVVIKGTHENFHSDSGHEEIICYFQINEKFITNINSLPTNVYNKIMIEKLKE